MPVPLSKDASDNVALVSAQRKIQEGSELTVVSVFGFFKIGMIIRLIGEQYLGAYSQHRKTIVIHDIIHQTRDHTIVHDGGEPLGAHLFSLTHLEYGVTWHVAEDYYEQSNLRHREMVEIRKRETLEEKAKTNLQNAVDQIGFYSPEPSVREP